MKNVFEKVESKTGTFPYSASKICYNLTEYAKGYIKHDESLENTKIRDAVLVDFINYIASYSGCDFGLYSQDLYEKMNDENLIEPEYLITILLNYIPAYLFGQNYVESVTANAHMHTCDTEINPHIGATFLVDFANFILQINDYENVYTLKELYNEYKEKEHKKELAKLREFLTLTGKYFDMLEEEIDIDVIYEYMARRYNLKEIDEDGTYHYNDALSNRFGRSEFFLCDKEDFDEDIYAMGYAFAKTMPNDVDTINTQIIKDKILEMKQK